jgi:serine/threonine protein kinase
MSPEALRGDRPSTACDIWSLGVLVWEIFTFANTPFPELANSEVKGHVLGGNAPAAPKDVPNGVYVIPRIV